MCSCSSSELFPAVECTWKAQQAMNSLTSKVNQFKWMFQESIPLKNQAAHVGYWLSGQNFKYFHAE